MEDDIREINDISQLDLDELSRDTADDDVPTGGRRRRKKVTKNSGVSDEDLIAQFLSKNKIKKCPPSYADGALSKGHWDL